MRLDNLFNRQSKKTPLPLFDEGFLRRLERLNFRTAPTLRGGMAGERRSRTLRPALDFADHRPYSHGDDLRHVDWKAYSRHEELFVRLGEATQSVNVHVLLDASPSMAWSPAQKPDEMTRQLHNPQSQKWDSARRLAGALGYLALSGGERLEVTAFAQTLGQSFGPTQGKRQVIPLLNFLTAVGPASPTKPAAESGLVHSLSTYARRQRGGLLVIISDLLDTAATVESAREWDELAEALRFFPPPRWQVVVMHYLTQLEMEPNLEGDYDLQDVETGQSLPFHFDESTLAQYRLRVKRWCAQLQHASARRAATYARVLAEWPFERSVVPYLRQRGVVQ